MTTGTSAPSDEALRQRWCAGSTASGWAYPSDWHVPAVDAVCEAVWAGADVWPAAERLGRERAATGVSLGETLADIDVLVSVSPAGQAEVLCRAASLGWADRVTAPPDAVADAMTGLASADYLRVRLSEIYRAAEVEGSSANDRCALVVVRLGGGGPFDLDWGLAMVLVGDAMRTVFDGGQSLARIGRSVAVTLAGRDAVLPRRVGLLVDLIATRSAADGLPTGAVPQVWVEPLPPGYSGAADLLAELGR